MPGDDDIDVDAFFLPGGILDSAPAEVRAAEAAPVRSEPFRPDLLGLLNAPPQTLFGAGTKEEGDFGLQRLSIEGKNPMAREFRPPSDAQPMAPLPELFGRQGGEGVRSRASSGSFQSLPIGPELAQPVPQAAQAQALPARQVGLPPAALGSLAPERRDSPPRYEMTPAHASQPYSGQSPVPPGFPTMRQISVVPPMQLAQPPPPQPPQRHLAHEQLQAQVQQVQVQVQQQQQQQQLSRVSLERASRRGLAPRQPGGLAPTGRAGAPAAAAAAMGIGYAHVHQGRASHMPHAGAHAPLGAAQGYGAQLRARGGAHAGQNGAAASAQSGRGGAAAQNGPRAARGAASDAAAAAPERAPGRRRAGGGAAAKHAGAAKESSRDARAKRGSKATGGASLGGARRDAKAQRVVMTPALEAVLADQLGVSRDTIRRSDPEELERLKKERRNHSAKPSAPAPLPQPSGQDARERLGAAPKEDAEEPGRMPLPAQSQAGAAPPTPAQKRLPYRASHGRNRADAPPPSAHGAQGEAAAARPAEQPAKKKAAQQAEAAAPERSAASVYVPPTVEAPAIVTPPLRALRDAALMVPMAIKTAAPSSTRLVLRGFEGVLSLAGCALGALLLVLMGALNLWMQLHRYSLREVARNYNVALCFAFPYSFGHIVYHIKDWAPHWAPICLWYSFLVQLFCTDAQGDAAAPPVAPLSDHRVPPRHGKDGKDGSAGGTGGAGGGSGGAGAQAPEASPLTSLFRILLPLLFVAEGTVGRTFLLDLNGMELLLVSYMLYGIKVRCVCSPVFLLAWGAMVLVQAMVPPTWYMQYALFMFALTSLHIIRVVDLVVVAQRRQDAGAGLRGGFKPRSNKALDPRLGGTGGKAEALQPLGRGDVQEAKT